MDFKQAVKAYNENPTDENLYRVASELRGELTPGEKLKMLSGKRFFFRNGHDLIFKGREY